MQRCPEELFNTLPFAEDLMLHSEENSFNSGGAWLLWFDYFLSQGCDVVIHETAKRLRLSYSDRSGTTQIPFQNGERRQTTGWQTFLQLKTLLSACVKRCECWLAVNTHTAARQCCTPVPVVQSSEWGIICEWICYLWEIFMIQNKKIWENLWTLIFLLSSQCPETLILLGAGLIWSHNPILLTCLHFFFNPASEIMSWIYHLNAVLCHRSPQFYSSSCHYKVQVCPEEAAAC